MQLLRGNPLGIEITDTHVKLCELRKSGKTTQVKHYAMVELPEGAMNDGRIQDELMLARTFRKALEMYPWSTRNVHFAVPSQTVMVRFLKMPNVGEKALRKIVDFELKHNIHLPFDDPFYDFVKLESDAASKSEAKAFQQQWEAAATKEKTGANPFASPNEGSLDQPENMCDVMLTAVPMELLQQYVRLFGDLGMQMTSFEIKAFSLNRLQKATKPQAANELSLLVDVGATNCDLTIVQNGFIRITRNVPISFMAEKAQSSDTLDAMFADFLPQTDNYEASFSDLTGEIERLINFYRYTLNHRDADFNKLVMTGDIPMMDELIAYMGRRMSMPVASAAWPELEVSAGWPRWELPVFAVPVGLCLRGGS